jgi:DNA-binding NarL/FixJ family response regulator
MHHAATAPSGRIRVVIIDSDDLVCQTVAALVGIGGRIEVVGMAGQSSQAIDVVTTTKPDVVLIDPRLPDIDGGLALVRELRAIVPGCRVLVICSPELLETAAAAEGVDRAVRKTYRPDELTAAIVAANGPLPA